MFLMKCYAALSAGSTCVHFVCLSHHRLVCVFRLVQDSQKRQRCAGCVCVSLCVFQWNRCRDRRGVLIYLNECLLMLLFPFLLRSWCVALMCFFFCFLFLGLLPLLPVSPAERLRGGQPVNNFVSINHALWSFWHVTVSPERIFRASQLAHTHILYSLRCVSEVASEEGLPMWHTQTLCASALCATCPHTLCALYSCVSPCVSCFANLIMPSQTTCASGWFRNSLFSTRLRGAIWHWGICTHAAC